MKLIFVTVENAVSNHITDISPFDGVRVANVPVPTETSIPEIQNAAELVYFQVRDSNGKILLQLPVANYIYVTGRDGDTMTFEQAYNVRTQRPADAIPVTTPDDPYGENLYYNEVTLD